MWRMSGGQDEGMWGWHVILLERGLSYMCHPQSGVTRVPWLPHHHGFAIIRQSADCRV
jgi:hypothetical protein